MVNKCWSQDEKPKFLTIMLYFFLLFEPKVYLVLVHVYQEETRLARFYKYNLLGTLIC